MGRKGMSENLWLTEVSVVLYIQPYAEPLLAFLFSRCRMRTWSLTL